MAAVSSSQVRTGLKEIIRRSDGPITRRELLDDVVLELDINREEAADVLDLLDRKGEVYHVGDDGTAEVRIP